MGLTLSRVFGFGFFVSFSGLTLMGGAAAVVALFLGRALPRMTTASV